MELELVLNEGDVVLFQGDSITDCGRDRSDPNDLGNGYAMMVASWFSASFPERRVTFLNRGISGNRVKDLVSRWVPDCLDLEPSWVSILIGINDCWRRYDSNDPTSLDVFEDGYRRLLDQVKDKLKARIVLCEPFVLPVPQDRLQWREDLDPKITVTRNLAREYGALLVPLDGLFAQASSRREPAFWTPDGVHPSKAGHALIARAWLQAVGAL